MFEPLEKQLDTFGPEEILAQLESLLEFQDASVFSRYASLANASALLGWYVKEINWVGFYLVDYASHDSQLILGPFQGSPACVYIEKGKGVCGTAWKESKTMVVADVLQFPGHIACDAASRSEVVVPLRVGEQVVGVLDVDSPTPNRFSPEDVTFFESAATIISRIFAERNEGK